jgi:hypothetical protein
MTRKQIASFMLSLLLLLFILLLSSCGSKYYLRRVKHNELMAISKGAVITADTLYKKVSFSTPGIKVQYEPRVVSSGSPMIFLKDSVRTVVKIIAGKAGKDSIIYVSTDCPPESKQVTVPISVDKKIGPSSNRYWPWLILIGIFIGASITILISKTLVIQRKQ